MTENANGKNSDSRDIKQSSWGPKLFVGALVAILAFFYWLLIYSGGVTVYHG